MLLHYIEGLDEASQYIQPNSTFPLPTAASIGDFIQTGTGEFARIDGFKHSLEAADDNVVVVDSGRLMFDATVHGQSTRPNAINITFKNADNQTIVKSLNMLENAFPYKRGDTVRVNVGDDAFEDYTIIAILWLNRPPHHFGYHAIALIKPASAIIRPITASRPDSALGSSAANSPNEVGAIRSAALEDVVTAVPLSASRSSLPRPRQAWVSTAPRGQQAVSSGYTQSRPAYEELTSSPYETPLPGTATTAFYGLPSGPEPHTYAELGDPASAFYSATGTNPAHIYTSLRRGTQASIAGSDDSGEYVYDTTYGLPAHVQAHLRYAQLPGANFVNVVNAYAQRAPTPSEVTINGRQFRLAPDYDRARPTAANADPVYEMAERGNLVILNGRVYAAIDTLPNNDRRGRRRRGSRWTRAMVRPR